MTGSLDIPDAPQELAVALDERLLLVAGDEGAVTGYLRALAERGIEWARGEDTALTQKAAFGLASAVGIAGTSGEYVKLSPGSLALLRQHHVVPAGNGYFHMTVRDQQSRFAGQMQWAPAELVGHQALALQTMATSAALMLAIREVSAAVEAVESKVDDVLALAEAQHVGDVLGRYKFLRQTLDAAEKADALAPSSWDAVAAVGADVSVTVERLRSFLLASVRSLPLDAPAGERARKLRRLVSKRRFSEALGLLVVAQQSLYLWQRLRLMHMQAREPEHLPQANGEARELLSAHEEADGELVADLYHALSSYGALRPLEVHRRLSKRKLRDDVTVLRVAFVAFAGARNAQVSSWPEMQDPKMRDALNAMNAGARIAGRRVQALGAGAISSTSGWLGRLADRRREEPARLEVTEDHTDDGTVQE